MRKERVFLRIGELTVQFATLEHRLQQLLEILIGEGNILIGPLLIHNLNLVSLLRRIRLVAPCRICENRKLLQDLERTIKRIDTIRGERNLLIHGDWQIKDADSFPIKVRDFKMKCEAGTWQEFTETAFTEKKMTNLIRRLKGLVNEVDYLGNELHKAQIALNTADESS